MLRWLADVNLFQAHRYLLYAVCVLIFTKRLFGFYGNFSSVWACSLHEYLQVLKWQPRPVKAFRACGIKTRSALLKVRASIFAKYSHILLMGYNGRVLVASNRSLCFPSHSLFINGSKFLNIFSNLQQHDIQIERELKAYFAIKYFVTLT